MRAAMRSGPGADVRDLLVLDPARAACVVTADVRETATLIAKTTALTDPVAQEVELRASCVTATDDLDLGDAFRVQREDTLDTFVGHDTTHSDHAVDAAAALSDQHTLENLDPLLLAFDDPYVHVDRVTDAEDGIVGFGLELVGNNRFDEFLHVRGGHGENPLVLEFGVRSQ